jgi:hypothetical protein
MQYVFPNLQTVVSVQKSENSEIWHIRQNLPGSKPVSVMPEQAIQEIQAALDRYEIDPVSITDAPEFIFLELRLPRDFGLYVKRFQTPVWSPLRITASQLAPSPFLSEWFGN